MPVELFGFSLGRKKEGESLSSTNLTVPQSKKSRSFVTQEVDDAVTIDAGGVFGTYVDLDGALKTENDYIKKYREMANQPECEQAVEDICNEAIVYD